MRGRFTRRPGLQVSYLALFILKKKLQAYFQFQRPRHQRRVSLGLSPGLSHVPTKLQLYFLRQRLFECLRR